MQVLGSYASGSWFVGQGKKQTLLNPATEEAVAEISSEGLDLGRAFHFARETGGKELRALTFAERAEVLLAISRALHKEREALIDLAMKNGGNTRGDAKFDIDGASGTLAYYAGLGKELGAKRVLVEGESAQLSRGPRFVGQHALVPRRGVALLINAFNFPAWGIGEKAACALLAGMPILIKPATSTALVATRIVELIAEQNLAPKGAISLLNGPAGNLTDFVSGEDVISFTGGSKTAAMLRALPSVVSGSLRLNIEADSLNAAVLGADVELGSDTWNAFVRDVSRDITQKAGQKCTAIRRIFVPKDRLSDATEALVERLREIVVGNPTEDSVTMGPVATSTQLADVRAGIERLAAESSYAIGADPFQPLGAPAGKGFFVQPTLFFSNDAARENAVHAHEVFGPCASVLGYEGNEAAVDGVRKGGGALVSSIYTDDRRTAGELALGMASAHGRLVITNAKIAEQTVGPGTVLPHSIHGGPGRAGGGEELGGLRGLSFYSHRVALQGDRPLLEALLG